MVKLIPKRSKYFVSFEAEMDIAYHYLALGQIDKAMPYLNRANKLICFKENMDRLGTLEVAQEKYTDQE